jgi:hypothetical protein
MILTTIYLAGAKNTIVGVPGRGICSVLFFDTVPMVPSSAFIATAGSERLLCDGFSLGETVRFGSLELIANRFGGPSLSPLGTGLGTTTMGPTYGRPMLPQRIMVGNPTEGFPMAPSGEGRTDLPFPGRHDVKASPTSTTMVLRPESPPANQAMTTIPLR